MVDISGDRGSLVRLASFWLQAVAGAWMGDGERERCGMRELTHCAVASKQARVRVRAAAARQTDPQVHALQYSTAPRPHTHPATNTVSAVIAPLPSTQHARLRNASGRRRQPCPASLLSTSHLTLPLLLLLLLRRTDQVHGCHLFIPGR